LAGVDSGAGYLSAGETKSERSDYSGIGTQGLIRGLIARFYPAYTPGLSTGFAR
jgi:hypothetical protein